MFCSFHQNKRIRVAAFVTAAFMLLTAVSCGKDKKDTSSDTAVSHSDFTQMDVEEMPDSLSGFLEFFADWYVRNGGQKDYYDAGKAGEGDTNILSCIVNNPPCVSWNSYPVKEYEEVWGDKKTDPKNWSKTTYGCYFIFDQKSADWVAKNIFNVTDKDIEAMRRQGEENKWFYLHKGNYYVTVGGIGDPPTVYSFLSCQTDGKKYLVDYDCYYFDDDPEKGEFVASYSAELELKNIDGSYYWSLYKFETTKKGNQQ